MKVIKLSTLLASNMIGLALLSSCGGGSNGNGAAQQGCYVLNANVITPSPIYSVTQTPQIIVPADVFNFNISLDYICSNSSTLNATVTSASLCFEDDTIPGGECINLPAAGAISISKPISFPYTFNYYKYGAMALSANPFQDTTIISYTNSQLLTSSSNQNTYSITMPSSYQPTYNLSNTNIVPGTITIPYDVVYQELSSTTISSTTITNSNTSTTNTFLSSSIGSFTASGFCLDNSNSSFTYTSSLSGINCQGSINYTNGTISSFSINAPSTTTLSYTVSNTTTNQNSYTLVITNEFIYNTLSSPSPSISNIYYEYYTGNQNINSNTVYGELLGSYTTYSYPFYQVVSLTPLFVSYTPVGSSSTNILQCSQTTCSISNNIFQAFLPMPVSGASLYYKENILQTFNPSITISQHTQAVSIPAIFYVNILFSDGESINTSYSFSVLVQSP